MAVKKVVKEYKGLSWVHETDVAKTTDVFEILSCCRWDASTNQRDANIHCLTFNGEKSGSDFILFKAIAPFVEAGGCIEMEGEDGLQWRWLFDGKTCTEQYAKTVWE